MVLEDQPFESAFLVQNRHFLVVHGTAEHVGRGVDVRVHEAGNGTDGRGRRREDAALGEHFTRAENRREPGGTDDRDSGSEQLSSRCVVKCGVAGIGAAEVDRAGRMGPAAAVGEFPSGEIGPKHGTASWVEIGRAPPAFFAAGCPAVSSFFAGSM